MQEGSLMSSGDLHLPEVIQWIKSPSHAGGGIPNNVGSEFHHQGLNPDMMFCGRVEQNITKII